MFGCRCPPKQAKPDIPRDHSKKRKKGRQKKKKNVQVYQVTPSTTSVMCILLIRQ